jgi:hypothetical protein
MSKEIEILRALLESGEFHHATYRGQGTVWEGLWFYRTSSSGFRGYEVAGCVNARLDADDLDAAHALVAHTGISVGSYGNG